MQALITKAKEAYEIYKKHSLKKGISLGFRATGTKVDDMKVHNFEGNSDAAYYTGLALGAECQSLWSGDDSAKDRIHEIVETFAMMQELHGVGLITRNVHEGSDGPSDWVKTEYKGKTYYWQGFLTYDQVVSVMWGYYNTRRVWQFLLPETRSLIIRNVHNIVNHFDKHNGFRGHQTNLSGSPSHVSFLWKHIMRMVTPGRWNTKENNRQWYWKFEDWFNWHVVNLLNFCVFKPFSLIGIYPKKSHILFSAMIYQVGYDITEEPKWKKALDKHNKKWDKEIASIASGPEVMDTAFGQWYTRMLYRIKNLTFSVPSSIIYSGNHNKSGISNTLSMLALHPLAKEEPDNQTRYFKLMKRKYESVEYANCPFFMALYEDTSETPHRDLLEKFLINMKLFRGPRFAYYGEPEDTTKRVEVMKYTGKTSMMPLNPVPQDKRDYHGSWSQSGVYSHARQQSGSNSQFGGFGEYLFCYFWGLNRNLF